MKATFTRLYTVLAVLIFVGSAIQTTANPNITIIASVGEHEKAAQTWIEVVTGRGEFVMEVLADDNGKAKLRLEAGQTYLIRFSRPGCIRKQVLIDALAIKCGKRRFCFRFDIELFPIAAAPSEKTFHTVAKVHYSKLCRSFVFDRQFSSLALCQLESKRASYDAISKR